MSSLSISILSLSSYILHHTAADVTADVTTQLLYVRMLSSPRVAASASSAASSGYRRCNQISTIISKMLFKFNMQMSLLAYTIPRNETKEMLYTE